MARKPRPVLRPDYWKPKNAKEGQPRINAQLVIVDRIIIETLEELIAMVSAMVSSAKANQLKEIKDLLKEADETSAKIAHIEPPGCDPRYPPPDSKPKTSAS